jgi:hypothetical protein
MSFERIRRARGVEFRKKGNRVIEVRRVKPKPQ